MTSRGSDCLPAKKTPTTMASGLAQEWCGPERQASDIREVIALTLPGAGDAVLCLTGHGRRGAGPPLLLTGGAGLQALALPEELPRLGKVWALPGPPGDTVLAVSSAMDCLYKLTFSGAEALLSPSAEPVVALPTNVDTIDVWVDPSGALTIAAFDDRCEPIGPDDPRVEPPPERPLDLMVWSTEAPEWRDVCQAQRESGGLTVSAGAAVWLSYNSYISEESSAGAFFGVKLTPDSDGAVESLTPPDSSLPKLQSGALPAGAGKVRGAAFSPDGSTLVLHANFSVEHAVTAAPGLWETTWPADSTAAVSRITPKGQEIQKFGLCTAGKTQSRHFGGQNLRIYTEAIGGQPTVAIITIAFGTACNYQGGVRMVDRYGRRRLRG